MTFFDLNVTALTVREFVDFVDLDGVVECVGDTVLLKLGVE